jgi:hypothetical protein
MAFGVLALLLLTPAVVAPAAACSGGGEGSMIGVINGMAPKCFEACEELCAPMDALVAEYLKDPDTEKIKRKVCTMQQAVSCLFKPQNSAACEPLLSAGAQFGVKLPTSVAELEEQCGALGSDTTTSSPGGNSSSTNSSESTTFPASTSFLPPRHKESEPPSSQAAGARAWARLAAMLVALSVAAHL